MENMNFKRYEPYRLDVPIDFREWYDYGPYAIARIGGPSPLGFRAAGPHMESLNERAGEEESKRF